ncbi:sialic acid-binding Ig-like lectin 11 isoform X2 [Stegostoma tigrinum]|uniref:sialic acid-binding Ig-like lectin 11 isoform X2 n=1 Tax=Stegostoma tigrinum TaxID=3053191 RepID=UPI0028700690|nr:sialic acid-binding Ig-like lectin 11 isoform X2 [Stegostoma tigrinum]
MFGKYHLLLSFLQAGLAQEWKIHTPREVTTQEGSCAQIPCNYSCPSHLTNQPRVGVWYYQTGIKRWSVASHSESLSNESPQFRYRTWLSGDLQDGDCSLIINNITREDAGYYYFKLTFVDKVKYKSKPATQLQVSDFTDKPMILPVEIIAGKHVSLRCTFNTTCNGIPPVLTWDIPTAIHGTVSEAITQHGVTLTYTSILSLIPWRRHHGQTLTCRVGYPHASSEQTLVINVQYTPENLAITSLDGSKVSSINIIEGESAVIICSVESFPASNLMWRHLNVTISRTTSNNELRLVISYITSKDTGDYQCVAENEHGAVMGSITITVQHAPENLAITSLDGFKASSINVTEGESAVIICSVESFPASNLTWRHFNVTINKISSNNELWLEIPRITYRETGDYQCVAENKHGAVERSITITVEYPPRETTVSTSGASGGIREGHNVTLTCSSESVPPISHYTWFRVKGNTSTRLNSSSQILSFTPVTRGNDAGFYCTVTNPLGNSSSSMTHLNVEYKPEISQASKCAQRAEGITCVCAVNSNPPGDLTWHLPHTNLSGNQTQGGFVSLQLREGHLVTGSLFLTGPQDDEEVTVSCSVRNLHGTATFKVYQVKGRDYNNWTLGFIMTGSVLSVFLAGILFFLCARKVPKTW